jgi:hypothetical protein
MDLGSGEARREQAEGEERAGGQGRHHRLLQVTCWYQVVQVTS